MRFLWISASIAIAASSAYGHTSQRTVPSRTPQSDAAEAAMTSVELVQPQDTCATIPPGGTADPEIAAQLYEIAKNMMSLGGNAWEIVSDATTPELPLTPYYQSVRVVAREVLLFDRSKPEYHLLLANLEWMFARPTLESSFNVELGERAFAAATCAFRLAELAGDSSVAARADTLLGWMRPVLREERRR